MEEINEDQYVRDEFNLSESKTFSFSSIYYFLFSLFNCLYILFLLLKRKNNIFLACIYQSINSFLKLSPFTY